MLEEAIVMSDNLGDEQPQCTGEAEAGHPATDSLSGRRRGHLWWSRWFGLSPTEFAAGYEFDADAMLDALDLDRMSKKETRFALAAVYECWRECGPDWVVSGEPQGGGQHPAHLIDRNEDFETE